MENHFMSIDKVASYFGVSTVTVRRWLRSGKLIGQKAGGQWRFNEENVRDAFERGDLSGASRPVKSNCIEGNIELPEWAKIILNLWKQSLAYQLDEVQPDHVIVVDRTGAKVWSLLMPNRCRWGDNLWHSTAVRMMSRVELERNFAHRTILLFDEMMQYGREMHEMREYLESLQASVFSFVCVRKRSFVESGRTIEYKAVACEDLDDIRFAERATEISKLSSLFDPPLDPDHIVVPGTFNLNMDTTEILTKIAQWGLTFVVRHPDPDAEHRFLTITLDRPQFFNTAAASKFRGFSIEWAGPCKIRFYLDLKNGASFCSFIVYPVVKAPRTIWDQTSAKMIAMQGNANIEQILTSDFQPDNFSYERIYQDICGNLALMLLEDFIRSGAATEIGIKLGDTPDLDSKARATFGPSFGEEIVSRTRQILDSNRSGLSLPLDTRATLPTLLREYNPDVGYNRDVFECRKDFLECVPSKFISNASNYEKLSSIAYSDLFERLSQYSESTIGCVLDFELDWGTVKPVVEISEEISNGELYINAKRAFCRGEYGPWFEFESDIHAYEDDLIEKTLVIAPMVVERFLMHTGKSDITATHFAKLFANLCHDWDSAKLGKKLYLGWRPYKFGPVPVLPIMTPTEEYLPLDRFLIDNKCMTEERKTSAGANQQVMLHTYRPADESVVPWRLVFNRMTDGTEKAFIGSLVRLYAIIQKECSTTRPSFPGSSRMAILHDPLIVLGAARNEKIAYRCGWFEVNDWRDKGRLLFPLLKAIAANEQPKSRQLLKEHIQDFAAPARLLYDKIEMYRYLPYLRDQIVRLASEGHDFAQILLETMDVTPTIEEHCQYPMKNLEWACSTMRAFSSFLRQMLTVCKLDDDERSSSSKLKKGGAPRDANYYLGQLMESCPEVGVALEDDLRECINLAKSGRLTETIASTLSQSFHLILDAFDKGNRIPDPRPWRDQAREHLQKQDGLLIRFKEVQMPEPYAIAVLDVFNFLRLTKIGEILGISYEEALLGMTNWVEVKARSIADNHRGTQFVGLTGDQIIFASPEVNQILETIDELMLSSRVHLNDSVDHRLATLSLFRGGISWCEKATGKGYGGVEPGLLAYHIGDKSGVAPGTIRITEAVYKRLSSHYREKFKDDDEDSLQGRVFAKAWTSSAKN